MGAFVHHIPFVRRGGGKKVHRAVFYGDRSKLFWISLYKLITVYTRTISLAKNNNYTVVWLGGAEPPYVIIGGAPDPPAPPSAATAALTVPLPSTSHWVLNSGARHKLTFHASMHAVYNLIIFNNRHDFIIVHNLSGLLLSIIIQDLIIHNKDWTIDNNYFNRSRHDSRQLQVDYITAIWKHSDTRSVYVNVVV